MDDNLRPCWPPSELRRQSDNTYSYAPSPHHSAVKLNPMDPAYEIQVIWLVSSSVVSETDMTHRLPRRHPWQFRPIRLSRKHITSITKSAGSQIYDLRNSNACDCKLLEVMPRC